MKKIFILLAILPITLLAQVRLGFTETQIRAFFPDNIFVKNRLTDGTRYISTDMQYGNFAYYFGVSNLSILNIQIPHSNRDLNTLVAMYNEKYVVINPKKWMGYLDNGEQIIIEMVYLQEKGITMFTYEINVD